MNSDIIYYPIAKVKPSSWNPNRMTPEKLDKLVDTIKITKGQYLKDKPIIVRKREDDMVEIIYRESTYLACKKLKYKNVPVQILDVTEEKAKRLAVILNRNKEHLDYLLLSKLLNEEKEKLGCTQKELGIQFGYSRNHIKNLLKIYPRLIKNYDEEWWLATNFSNKILEELSRVIDDKLREQLIIKTKERAWKSERIRPIIKKFNNISTYIHDISINETERVEILSKIPENLLFDFNFSALKNRIDEIYKKISEMKVILGDCFKILANSKFSIDHIITDPPYNISNNREVIIPNKSPVKKDFGEWDHFKSKEVYLNFQRKWLQIALPMLKEGGTILIFTAFEYGGYLIDILRELGIMVRNNLVWHKSNPPPNHKTSDLSSCEYIIYATKGKNGIYNWLGSKKAHNFIETSLCQGNERTCHRTQKPLEVMFWLLDKYTNPGDLILDPLAGSGSTGVACKLKGRNYILIEEKEEFYDIIKMRLESIKE